MKRNMRLLSLLLAVVMVIGMVPFSALATDSAETAVCEHCSVELTEGARHSVACPTYCTCDPKPAEGQAHSTLCPLNLLSKLSAVADYVEEQAAGTTTEAPTTESTTAPATEPGTDPTTAPTTEPTTAPTTAPATEPTTAPTTEPTTEPTTAPTTEPTTEPTTAPTTEPATEPSTEATEPSTEATEPTVPEVTGPQVGDKIWIKSGSKVYIDYTQGESFFNAHDVLFNYEVVIKSIITDENGAPVWYEYDGSGTLLAAWKYVKAENTTTQNPDATEPEETIQKEATAGGTTIQVSGSIPEDVSLAVEAVEVNAQPDTESAEPAPVFAFDIKLLNADGSEWQPESGKTVSVTLDAAALGIEDGTIIWIVHEHGGAMNELGSYPVEEGKLTFTTGGFSVFYGYTVDFEYDGTWHSIGGGGIILLSELFDALEIDKSVSNVSDVEFSDPALMSVSYENIGSYVPCYDWILRSLEPFSTEEMLTVSFKNGDVLHIKVYDASYTALTNGMTLGNDTLNGAISVSGNTTITVNGTVTLNGNITIQRGATLTINGSGTIKRGTSNVGAMFTVANGGKLNINAITIDGAASWTANQIQNSTRKTLTVSGVQAKHAAIYAAGGATITLNGTKLQNLYTSKYAAAIHTLGTVGNKDNIPPSTVTLKNVKFNHCASTSDNSIVLLNYSYATLTGCEFIDNYAGYRYAGIIKAGGPSNFCLLRMNNCTATNNYSSGWGGVILWAANTPYNGTKTEAIITNCIFTNNTARYLGGAISNEAIMTVSGCTITGNTAMSGGGIATFPYTRTEDDELADGNACGLTLGTGNIISDNNSVATGKFKPFSSEGNGADQDETGTLIPNIIEYTGGGGGVWCYMNKSGWNCGLEIGTGNTIQSNDATNIGGGVLVEHVAGNVTELKITGAEITENSANKGGGVAVTNATVSIESGEIKSNVAATNGGGIYVDNGTCTVTGTGSVSTNSAANGGGIYIDGGSDLTVSGGIITGNNAVCAQNAANHICTPTAHGAHTAMGNNSGVGGGVYVAKGSLELDPKEGSSVGLYGNIADFAADDAYASNSESYLKLPDVAGMPLAGTAYAAVDGWYIDYCAGDTNYPASLYANKENPGRYRSQDGERISAGKAVEGGEYYCLTLGRTPTLVIEKRVPGVTKPDETFTFKITNSNNTAIKNDVTFEPDDFEYDSSANVWIATETVSKMPVGTIKVKETLAQNTRFKLTSVNADVDIDEAVSDSTITFTMTDDGEKVIYVNEWNLANLILRKVITAPEGQTATAPDQSFRFTVTNVTTGESIEVLLSMDDFNKGTTAEVTIKDLLVGTYTIQEDTNWSWRYSCVDATHSVELTGAGAKVEFENQRTKDQWLDGEANAKNVFNKVQ